MKCIICNLPLNLTQSYTCPVNDYEFQLRTHYLIVWGNNQENFSITLNSENFLKNIDIYDTNFFTFSPKRVLWNYQGRQLFEFKKSIAYKDAYDFIKRIQKLRAFL